MLYVHLNRGAACLAQDPARHRWCGHREALDRWRKGLVDVDELGRSSGRERPRLSAEALVAVLSDRPGGRRSWQ